MNLTELEAAVQAWLNKPAADQQFTLALSMAEAVMQRTLRTRRMVGRSWATVDNEYEILPADFAGVRSLELAADSPTELEFVTPERLAKFASIYTTPGAPIYYTVVGRNFRYSPRPATPYPGSQLTYWRTIPGLSPSNTSNWVLEFAPDAYVYGVLTHLAKMLSDDRHETWAATFQGALTGIMAADPIESGKPA